MTALALYKTIVGNAPASGDQGKYISGIREQLKELDHKLGSMKKHEELPQQYKFFDDKALY